MSKYMYQDHIINNVYKDIDNLTIETPFSKITSVCNNLIYNYHNNPIIKQSEFASDHGYLKYLDKCFNTLKGKLHKDRKHLHGVNEEYSRLLQRISTEMNNYDLYKDKYRTFKQMRTDFTNLKTPSNIYIILLCILIIIFIPFILFL